MLLVVGSRARVSIHIYPYKVYSVIPDSPPVGQVEA